MIHCGGVDTALKKSPLTDYITKEFFKSVNCRIRVATASNHCDFGSDSLSELYSFKKMLKLKICCRHRIADKHPFRCSL